MRAGPRDDLRASILVVDDSPEQLLAIEAVLETLGARIVRAGSGRAALRALLAEEFAVILLDVNMPGMDGFETASLIRQRKSFARTPIIFLTSFGDDAHAARGYELGAVDYIATPVMPEVLRSKVAVFIELFSKTQQVKLQAESLSQRATQLHKLTAAAMAINAAVSTEKTLQVAADTAREIIGCHQAAATTTTDHRWSTAMHLVSVSEELRGSRAHSLTPDGTGLSSVVCQSNRPMRLSELELQAAMGGRSGSERRAMRGWLAAPFTGRDGRNMGILQLSSKYHGEFTDDDEAMLVQLAQTASIAIENTIFAREREVNRIKDEFLATLSHELRTPLSAILGWTQLLRERDLADPDAQHALVVIERNAKAQTKLIEDLLDVSRITTGKLAVHKRTVDLGAVVRTAVDALKPQVVAKSLAVEVELPGEGVHVHGDPDRLEQVAQNLVSNAVKFTPKDGHIRVCLERLPTRVRLTVTDSGRGISREFLPYVFDRFRQADSTSTRNAGGLGIGLTIVRHLVELHGGTVAAESRGEGRGATFTVELPLLETARVRAEGRRTPALAPVEGGLRADVSLEGIEVLVVDDEPDTRDLLTQVLRESGARVIAVASVRDALGALDTEVPDVIVSDIAMPEEDGYSLMRQLRQRPVDAGAAVPAIALTAYTREEDRLRALSAGFQVHLSKPIEPADFVAAVAQLAGRALVSDAAVVN